MNLIYCQATNTGKNFYTKQDRLQFDLIGYAENIWAVGDTNEGNAWIARVSGVVKTKLQAQTILDANYETAVTNYNTYVSSLTEEAKTLLTGAGRLKPPTKTKL